jgi:MEMO1 family protein
MSEPEQEVPGPADFALGLVRLYVSGQRAPDPPDHPFYQRRAACFVTLKKHGQLRGCIGTLEPGQASLGWEIERNAFSSAMRDPRFPPVTGDEVEALTCSVDVLGASSACSEEDLDPGVYGVIVESGYKRGVLLPALEGVDTVEQQVSIALQKAGIAPDRGFDVRRFRVTRYQQGDPARELQDADAGPVCD